VGNAAFPRGFGPETHVLAPDLAFMHRCYAGGTNERVLAGNKPPNYPFMKW